MGLVRFALFLVLPAITTLVLSRLVYAFCVLLATIATIALSRLLPAFWKMPWFASQMRTIVDGDAVVVTGSSTGIGKHAALSLAKEGYTVFCCVRKEKDFTLLAEAAKKHGIDPTRVRPLILDVTNSTQITEAVATVSEWLKGRGLAGLFNNAGVGGEAPKPGASNAVEYQTMENYRWVMDVNFFGVVEVTKAFIPLLRLGKGRIVINTSIDGFMGTPFQSTYVASKFAAEGWADALHREVKYQGLHVAMLEPGFVTSSIIKKQAGSHGVDVEIKYDAKNYPQEQDWWEAFWTLSVFSSSPKVTSECVVHAIRAESPARRYLAGFGSQFMRIAPCMPDEMKDLYFEGHLLKMILPKASAVQIREGIVGSEREFEL
jgi:NAD(P)-dependent dehydrogenase (short-subunit alcohol dehydrogenase family)